MSEQTEAEAEAEDRLADNTHDAATGKPFPDPVSAPDPPAEHRGEDEGVDDVTEYGRMVDEMVAEVSTWPPEYQRSVDVHPETRADVGGGEEVERSVPSDSVDQPAADVSPCQQTDHCGHCGASFPVSLAARLRELEAGLASVRAFLLDPDLPDTDSLERVREELAELDPHA